MNQGPPSNQNGSPSKIPHDARTTKIPTAAAIASVRERWIGASPTVPSSSSAGNEQEQREVGDRAEPAEEHGHAEPDPEDQGVDVEVLAEPGRRRRRASGPSGSGGGACRLRLGLRLGGCGSVGRLRLGHLVGLLLVVHRVLLLNRGR